MGCFTLGIGFDFAAALAALALGLVAAGLFVRALPALGRALERTADFFLALPFALLDTVRFLFICL
jgi:hypothetical protein